MIGTFVLKDIRSDLRHSTQTLLLPAYFVLLILLFPLALGPAIQTLYTLAPGLLVLTALLASLMGIERLFVRDFENGFLESVLLSAQPLWVYVIGSLLAHIVLGLLPLIVLAPLLALMLGVPTELIFWPLAPVLAICLITLLLIGSIIRALTLGATQSRALIALITIPLYIPPLIFSTSTLALAFMGQAYESPFLLLCALALVFSVISPYLTAVLLRWSIRS